MALLTKVGKVAAPLAGALFIEPVLNFFAPSIKPLIRQFIQSEEAKQFLKDLVDGAAVAGSGVCSSFLGNQADKLLGTLKPIPKLDGALIAALRRTFEDMRDDLRERNQHNILGSFDQFFTDWDEKLKQVQADDSLAKELLETKQFSSLFYEWHKAEAEERAWWIGIKAELEAWTKYLSIPPELEAYLEENLLFFSNDALTSTLAMEEYKEAWDEFHKSIGTRILFILSKLETHIIELNELAKVAGGQFIHDEQTIEFPLRRPIDSLITDLSTKEIYVQREAVIVEETSFRVNGFQTIAKRDGYFLLAAPAGSGKSTLMARWLREFSSSLEASGQQRTANVCYHFYSKREGTSDYGKGLTILSDQLLKANHIQANVNSFNPATIDSIILNCLALDHPQRLLVIVDGLDEAGDPSTMTEFLGLFKRIFPKNLGKNTTVILTVRDDEGSNSLQHYRTELGLPLIALQLPEVGAESLASYLSTAADQRLRMKAGDETFLKQVIAKTEGLAIYVHYLLDELSQVKEAHWMGIIGVLPTGFEKYVSASLPAALDGKPPWEEALSFMALAQSPLGEQDLISLTKLSGHRLSKVDFSRVAWNIKRWLRTEEAEWAFSHAKIGEVFYELYVANECATYLEHLLAYCADWKQHGSRYVLLNYADLLRKQQKESELYALASNREFLSWQKDKLPDSPNAPLRTIQAGILYAIDHDNSAMMARFSLAHGAVVEDISVESWHEAYSRRGYLGALQVADYLNDQKRRVVWYLLIARQLIALNQPKDAEHALKRLNSFSYPKLPDELFFVAESILLTLLQNAPFALVKSIYTKALPSSELGRQFSDISKHLSQIGEFDKARQIADSIESPLLQSYALASIAAALTKAEHFSEDKEISQQPIQFIHSHESLSSHAHAEKVEESQKLFGEAEQIARAIENPVIQSEALSNIAEALGSVGYLDRAEELFDSAEATARSIEDPSLCRNVLLGMIPALARPEFIEKARRLAQSVRGPGGIYPKFLIRLATALADHEYFLEAMETIRDIEDTFSRSQALNSIALAYAKAGQVEQGIGVLSESAQNARSIYDAGSRIEALINIANGLAGVAYGEKAKELLVEAELGTRSIEDPIRLAQTLTKIAAVFFERGDLEEAKRLFNQAEQVASSIEYSVQRSEALKRIAAAVASTHQFRVVAASSSDPSLVEIDQFFTKVDPLADSVENPQSRIQALTSVAAALAHTRHFAEAEWVFAEAERIAVSIRNSGARSESQANLASALGHSQNFDKAEDIARSIKDLRLRSDALRNISSALAEANQFEEAKRIARSIKESVPRLQALGSIATALAHAGRLGEAKILFDEVKQDLISIKLLVSRSQVLRNLAVALTEAYLLQEVEKAQNIKESWSRSRTLSNIVTALAYAGFHAKGEEVAGSIKNPNPRSYALGTIATGLAHAGRFDEAARIFGEAERAANRNRDDQSRSQAFGYLARALVKANLFDEALRVVGEVRGNDLLAILDDLARAGKVEGLKRYFVLLSYGTDSALRSCAQMILLYDHQVNAIYREILPYIKEQ